MCQQIYELMTLTTHRFKIGHYFDLSHTELARQVDRTFLRIARSANAWLFVRRCVGVEE
jgi:hypothetical protein